MIKQVNALIDEIIIGGVVIETNITEILEAIKTTAEYEKKN